MTIQHSMPLWQQVLCPVDPSEMDVVAMTQH